MRMTKQRQVILEELTKINSHPTADELYEHVRRRLPRISLGTVYRNLELLSRHGLIKKLDIGGSQMRFDGDLERHHHVRCIRCGHIEDLPSDTGLTECDREMIRSTGFDVVERRVEFLGVCPACKSRESD
jgi:Fur family ferric uptake transcriptional regulator